MEHIASMAKEAFRMRELLDTYLTTCPGRFSAWRANCSCCWQTTSQTGQTFMRCTGCMLPQSSKLKILRGQQLQPRPPGKANKFMFHGLEFPWLCQDGAVSMKVNCRSWPTDKQPGGWYWVTRSLWRRLPGWMWHLMCGIITCVDRMCMCKCKYVCVWQKITFAANNFLSRKSFF